MASAIGGTTAGTASPSGTMPLIPVPEIAEILAEGDLMDRNLEPVASGFYDDLEMAGPSASK